MALKSCALFLQNRR